MPRWTFRCLGGALAFALSLTGPVGAQELRLEVVVPPTSVDGLVVLESRLTWPDEGGPRRYHGTQLGPTYAFDLIAPGGTWTEAWTQSPVPSCVAPRTLAVWPGDELRRLHVHRLPPELSRELEADEPLELSVRVRTRGTPSWKELESLPALSSEPVDLVARGTASAADAEAVRWLEFSFHRSLKDAPGTYDEIPDRLRAALETELSPPLRALTRWRFGLLAAEHELRGEAVRALSGLELPSGSLLAVRRDAALAANLSALGRDEEARAVAGSALAAHARFESECRPPEDWMEFLEHPRDAWGPHDTPGCWAVQGMRSLLARTGCDVGERLVVEKAGSLPPEDRRLWESRRLDHSALVRSLSRRVSSACNDGAVDPTAEEWVDKQVHDWLEQLLARERTARELDLPESITAPGHVLAELRLSAEALKSRGRRLQTHRPPYRVDFASLSSGEPVHLLPTRAEALGSVLDIAARSSGLPVPGGPGELAIGHDVRVSQPDGSGGQQERLTPMVSFLRGNVVVTVAAADQRLAYWLDEQVRAQLESRGIPESKLDSTPRVVAADPASP